MEHMFMNSRLYSMGLAAAFALSGCENNLPAPPPPTETENLATSNVPGRLGDRIGTANTTGAATNSVAETISIQTMAGSPKEKAMLLPTKGGVDLAAIAQAIRGSELTCDEARSARQLQQNDGKVLDVFKVDCSDGHAYQITMMNGQTFYKRWSGVIIGD
jgi:hypothetical protein